MKVLIASDHAGFELKNDLSTFLSEKGYGVDDFGPSAFNPADDYPDFVSKVARAVSESTEEVRGIIIGGSGEGEAMAANRFPNVRAAVYYGGAPDIIRLSREHNDANVLALGARFISTEEARAAVDLWLNTPFSHDERHARRIKKIERN